MERAFWKSAIPSLSLLVVANLHIATLSYMYVLSDTIHCTQNAHMYCSLESEFVCMLVICTFIVYVHVCSMYAQYAYFKSGQLKIGLNANYSLAFTCRW